MSSESDRLDQIDTNFASPFELSGGEVPEEINQFLSPALLTAATLGQRTGEMHLALASSTTNPEFAPELLGADEIAELSNRIQDDVRMTVATLKDRLPTLPDEARADAQALIAAQPRLLEMASRVAAEGANVVKIRCHGDYHLGQLLRVQGDFLILDFEGEPGLDLSERRAKHTPLKDVASMLRSIDYAVASALQKEAKVNASAVERLEPWAKIWKTWVSAEFLKSYRAVASTLMPTSAESVRQLLDLLVLEKALFELRYELDYRPDWVHIPIRGILNLSRPGDQG